MIDIITFLIIVIAGALFALLIAFPLHFMWKEVKTVIITVFILIITNIIGYPFNFQIGINPLTVLFISLLGVPGYTTSVLLALLL